MVLTKWDPFESLSALHSELENLLDRRMTPGKAVSKSAKDLVDWYPAVDIHESDKAYLFDVEAPGVEKDKFEVNVENDMLTVRGIREENRDTKGKNTFRVERAYGSFMRSFALPETADTDKVRADYKDGILHIEIGKKTAALPRNIPINVN